LKRKNSDLPSDVVGLIGPEGSIDIISPGNEVCELRGRVGDVLILSDECVLALEASVETSVDDDTSLRRAAAKAVDFCEPRWVDVVSVYETGAVGTDLHSEESESSPSVVKPTS
jgi:hypothetical protein